MNSNVELKTIDQANHCGNSGEICQSTTSRLRAGYLKRTQFAELFCVRKLYTVKCKPRQEALDSRTVTLFGGPMVELPFRWRTTRVWVRLLSQVKPASKSLNLKPLMRSISRCFLFRRMTEHSEHCEQIEEFGSRKIS